MERADYMILAIICVGAGLDRFVNMGEGIIAGNYVQAALSGVALLIAGMYFVKCVREALG